MAFPDDWQRLKIEIDHTNVSADLSNFPLLITEDNFSSGIWSNVKADGTDIVITTSDGLTKCDIDLEYINTSTPEMALWVDVPTVSSSVDTVLYFYYDNSGASEDVHSFTWDDYEFVSHDGGYTDATGNHTRVYDNTSPTAVDWYGGNSRYFNGASNFIDYDKPSGLTDCGKQDITIFCAVQRDSNVVTNLRFLYNGANSDSLAGWGFDASDTSWAIRVCDGSTRINTAASWTIGSTYNLLHIRLDYGANLYRYTNASLSGTTNISSITGNLNNSRRFLIGCADGGDEVSYHEGRMDEIRIKYSLDTEDMVITEATNYDDPASFYSVKVDLQSEIDGVSTVGGSVDIDTSLSSTIAGVSTAGGALDILTSLQSSIDGVSTAGGALDVLTTLKSVISGTSTAGGALDILIVLQSVIACTSTVSASLSTGDIIDLQAAISGASSVSAALQILTTLSSTISSISAVSGGVDLTRGLQSQIDTASTLTASLQKEIGLQSRINADSTVTAGLKRIRGLLVTINALSTVSANLKSYNPLDFVRITSLCITEYISQVQSLQNYITQVQTLNEYITQETTIIDSTGGCQ